MIVTNRRVPILFWALAACLPVGTAGIVLTFDVAANNLQEFVYGAGEADRFCEIGETPYGRGLVATRDLKAGDIALRIPLSCALVEPDCDEDDNWTGRLANRLLDRQECFYKAALPLPPSTPARGDWPESILQAFENPVFIEEVGEAQDWRYHQWEKHRGSHPERQAFLDALDLVCSRTIRIGRDLMLVPLLDMANHASRQQGGGYYKRDGSDICLMVGERGVRAGGEVTLDYGTRRNEDWLIHYGFLPDRNTAETIQLPKSKRTVSWDDVGIPDIALQRECLEYLRQSETSLEEDLGMLQDPIDDFRLEFAISYRVSRKILLSAVAGEKAACPSTSAFSTFAFVEN